LLFGLSFHYRSEGRLSAISCQVILYRLLMGQLTGKRVWGQGLRVQGRGLFTSVPVDVFHTGWPSAFL
jgi:hypothetical protein